jgi:nucleotide-binding universal stress UspA family protein
MLQHILVGLDGSLLAETILAYVSTLAKSLGAEVALLHVVHLSEDMQRGEPSHLLQPAIQHAETQAREYLSRVAQRLTDSGLTVRSQVRVGDAATEIVRAAQQEGAELIALATHGRSGLQRWVYGSVAEKVLHTTSTPLLLVRPTDEQGAAPLALTQIVVPLDGSSLAETALPLAETLAARAKASLVLLRVVEVLSLDFGGPIGMSYASYPQLLDSLQEAAEDYLTQLTLPLRGKDFSVHTEASVGLPADKIVKYAHEHPGSLIVMTTHGRTGLPELVLGSVARRVVLHGNTPILILRPMAASAPA